MKYRVYIDANAHHMDTSQRTLHGEYDSAAAAVAAAKEVVDARLAEAHRPGMRSADLLERYARRGEAPFILPGGDEGAFDARDYARTRAAQMCWHEDAR